MGGLLLIATSCSEPAYVLVPVGSGGNAARGGSSASDAGVGGVQATGGAGAAGGEGGASGAGAAGAAGADTCGDHQTGNNTVVCSASYLGGPRPDELTATDFAANGEVLLGGAFSTTSWTDRDVPLLSGAGATTGWLLRFSRDGRRLVAASRLGARVADLEVQINTGDIAVAGDFGAAILDPTGTTVLRHEALGGEPATRVAIGSSGTLAALTGTGTIWVFGREGLEFQFDVEGDANDLAVHDTTESLLVVGSLPPGEACAGRMPFFRSYGFDRAIKWRAYDHEPDASICDDSVGLRVIVGRDRALYYAGEHRGAASPHLRDPADLGVALGVPRLNEVDEWATVPPLTQNTYGFVARFDSRGQLQLAQSIAGRDGDQPTPFRVHALAADERGRVYLGGRMECCSDQRNESSLSGIDLPDYVAPENTLVIFQEQFDQRKTWTTWSGLRPGGASTTAVAASGDRAVMTVTFDAAVGELTTYQPYQSQPGGGLEGFFSVLPAPP